MRPDNKTIETRLQQLREEMRREHLSAFIFPSADPHMSEYVPERWEGRKWISGFDGSAGTAVVTLHGAALWTDSRYFLAAEEQLDGTEFTLMRERVEGTPSIAEWIGSQTEDADDKEVGVDGMCISLGEAEALKDELKHNGGICLRTNLDILSRIWTDRPFRTAQSRGDTATQVCRRDCRRQALTHPSRTAPQGRFRHAPHAA